MLYPSSLFDMDDDDIVRWQLMSSNRPYHALTGADRQVLIQEYYEGIKWIPLATMCFSMFVYTCLVVYNTV